MSIVDQLIENLVERNAIDLNGTFSVALVDGGIRITGTAASAVRDQQKNKTILRANAPIDARVSIGAIVIPVPQIR